MNLNRLIQACGMELHLRADHLSEADRAQAFRDAAVEPPSSTKCTASAGWLGADASADAGRESWIERLSPRCLGRKTTSLRAAPILSALGRHGSTLSLSEVNGAILQNVDVPMTEIDIVLKDTHETAAVLFPRLMNLMRENSLVTLTRILTSSARPGFDGDSIFRTFSLVLARSTSFYGRLVFPMATKTSSKRHSWSRFRTNSSQE